MATPTRPSIGRGPFRYRRVACALEFERESTLRRDKAAVREGDKVVAERFAGETQWIMRLNDTAVFSASS